MSKRRTKSVSPWLRVLLCGLLGLGAGGHGWAHTCPTGPAVPITYPANNATVSGQLRFQVYPTAPPSGFTMYGWDQAQISVMDPGFYPGDSIHIHAFLIQANPTNSGPWWTDLDTTTLPNGDYWVFSTCRLIPDDYPTHQPCPYGCRRPPSAPRSRITC